MKETVMRGFMAAALIVMAAGLAACGDSEKKQDADADAAETIQAEETVEAAGVEGGEGETAGDATGDPADATEGEGVTGTSLKGTEKINFKVVPYANIEHAYIKPETRNIILDEAYDTPSECCWRVKDTVVIRAK